MKDIKPYEDISLVDLLSPGDANIGGILTNSDKFLLREVFYDLRDFLFHLYRRLH